MNAREIIEKVRLINRSYDVFFKDSDPYSVSCQVLLARQVSYMARDWRCDTRINIVQRVWDSGLCLDWFMTVFIHDTNLGRLIDPEYSFLRKSLRDATPMTDRQCRYHAKEIVRQMNNLCSEVESIFETIADKDETTIDPDLLPDSLKEFVLDNLNHDFEDEWFQFEGESGVYDLNLWELTDVPMATVYKVYEDPVTGNFTTNTNNYYRITKKEIQQWEQQIITT